MSQKKNLSQLAARSSGATGTGGAGGVQDQTGESGQPEEGALAEERSDEGGGSVRWWPRPPARNSAGDPSPARSPWEK